MGGCIMNNEEIDSKLRECNVLKDQIQNQSQTVENYKSLLNNPEMVKLDNALDEALKRIENPTEFSLPEVVIHLIQAQQKHSSPVSEILTDIVTAQDKIIQDLGQIIGLETDIINSINDQ